MVRDKISKTIGDSLKEARREIGLSINEAAKKLGFDSYQTLSNIEKGMREVKAWELSKFASLYHKSLEFFLGLEHLQTQSPILWRNRKLDKKTKEIEGKIRKYCQDYSNIEELTKTKSTISSLCFLDKKPMNFVEVAQKAEDTYKLLGLGSRPARILPDVLEQVHGIKIVYLDMGEYGSAASILDENTGAAIIINTIDAPWRRNYDIAHELFHLLTWKLYDFQEVQSRDIKKSEVEKFADYFASTLLLPREPLERELQQYIEDEKLSLWGCVTVAREFCVSTIALLWRLVNLGYLKKSTVLELINGGELARIDRKERQADWDKLPPKSPRFVTLAFICLGQGLISRGRFAEMMDIEICAIPEFLNKYGYKENQQIFTAEQDEKVLEIPFMHKENQEVFTEIITS
jgi:Zn-dependent peptidase ImmA (M78 family)/transcriptional regulator with XRE-family HTH domain